jgi:Ca2+-transporting ATPase
VAQKATGKSNKRLAKWQDKLETARGSYNSDIELMQERDELFNGTRLIDSNVNSKATVTKQANVVRNIIFELLETQVNSSIPSPKVDTAFQNKEQLASVIEESIKSDIAVCRKAGIRVVMITGDNGITASSIAKKIGMDYSDNIITGDRLNEMSDDELREAVKNVSIFSRVVPEHKMRIVRAFKENGEIVAMTGDGVNDAPALKYADIGIAMGKRGSEVSREAADLILMDDNFTTIVETVRDGRRIYDNIRKAVGYVFTISPLPLHRSWPQCWALRLPR